jgi:aspartate/methionine/tyrosine aminotransferase
MKDHSFQEKPPLRGVLSYRRTPIEIESPEQYGYNKIRCNLAESSVSDLEYADLKVNLEDVVLSYTDHRGNPSLREKIAQKDVHEDDILVTAGAAAALFIAATSLLKPDDHAVILHPNYVTNIETPRALGCDIDYIHLTFENRFQINVEMLEQMIRPDTRLVSITYPHNPTGMTLNESELEEIVSVVESKSKECYLLVDETYREMTFHTPPPLAASLSPQVISVSSLSKSYGLPGIRIGWLITTDDALMETFLAAKEQIFICNSAVDEAIASQFLARKGEFIPGIRRHIKTNFEVVESWMTMNDHFEWIKPTGGCVSFPRINPTTHVDVTKFYEILNEKYKTFVGPGHWFGMDKRYMRIGYGWPSTEELEEGLLSVTRAANQALRTP